MIDTNAYYEEYYKNRKTFKQQCEEERAQTAARIKKLEEEGYHFYTLDEIRKLTPAEIDANWDRVQLSLKSLSRHGGNQ